MRGWTILLASCVCVGVSSGALADTGERPIAADDVVYLDPTGANVIYAGIENGPDVKNRSEVTVCVNPASPVIKNSLAFANGCTPVDGSFVQVPNDAPPGYGDHHLRVSSGRGRVYWVQTDGSGARVMVLDTHTGVVRSLARATTYRVLARGQYNGDIALIRDGSAWIYDPSFRQHNPIYGPFSTQVYGGL